MNLRAATSRDEAAVIGVITLGFSSDPMARWTLPDPGQYLRTMPAVVKAFGGSAFELGSADLVDGCAGAALWLPPGAGPDGDQLVELMKANAPEGVLDDALAIFDKMGTYHPQEPHWYLPLIAVDPAQQGRGLGSALMNHALARCDRDGVPAYLESSNPRNISLYRRCGFEILGTIQIGGSPPVTPMLRTPR